VGSNLWHRGDAGAAQHLSLQNYMRALEEFTQGVIGKKP
jgi:hypothetical protein